MAFGNMLKAVFIYWLKEIVNGSVKVKFTFLVQCDLAP